MSYPFFKTVKVVSGRKDKGIGTYERATDYVRTDSWTMFWIRKEGEAVRAAGGTSFMR